MNLLIVFFIVGYILSLGRDLFIPFVLALFFWFLIRTLANTIQTITKKRIALILCYALSTMCLALLVIIPIYLISSSVPEILTALPRYENNIHAMVNKILEMVPLAKDDVLAQTKDAINISGFLSYIANGIMNFTNNFMLILTFVGFFFAEQALFKNKILLIAKTKRNKDKANKIVAHIDKRITAYVSSKAQLSLLSAISGYLVMLLIGVDFPLFWAILIFILNCIPSIGSFIATLFPTMLALVQFDTPIPAALLFVGLSVIHFVIANVLEPKMMEKFLNLSPLALLISLLIWGSIWGVAGLLLSVPITVVIMIIMAEFKATRPVAILMSRDGQDLQS